MIKNAMAGAVTLCGVGLCMIGGALLMQNGQQAHAAVGSMPAAAAAVAAATNAQAGPTVVWYGTIASNQYYGCLFRAWSDGMLEMKRVNVYSLNCNEPMSCTSPWLMVASAQDGYRAAADINSDEKVDGADLASVLGNWGDAPRVPFPPSDCPLNLINP
jgi:hypothetical protein